VGLLVVSMIAVMVAVLGWEPSPWHGQVRVCRSPYHRVKLRHESGMTVRDAVAMSRAALGETAGESAVLYRWKAWLPERIPDATVMGLQGALGFAGLHGCSDALWQWWDGIVPRRDPWREIARGGSALDRPVSPGELIVLRREP
jgi:hypothetical protein